MPKAWYQLKWVQVCFHFIFWIIIFSLPYLLRQVYGKNNDPENNGFFYLGNLTGLLWTGTFYLNAYLLFPLLIQRKKYAWYGIIVLALYMFIIWVHGILFVHLVPNHQFYFLLGAAFNAPAYFLAIASSTIFQLIREKIESNKREQEKNEENLKTELSFLRSQISPHFIFNVLNNIVALARLKSDQLEPTVIKLSSLMQYMLYETNEERVLLKTETEYLKSYIDLQQQRFGNKVTIHAQINAADSFHEIEPMLLIPFVENAFKHGVVFMDNPEINIQLTTKDNRLYFTVRNKFNPRQQEVKDKASGIGLANVKRRLNLLYKDQHTIRINTIQELNNEYWFEVSLQLNLH
ncbi:sensor histidine kinase [Flavihumibacter petaseus]|uniref:Putative two-component histidine kinase n=1 Tax=Flavihumibacter petaseus NBRC 106054 TaxID=1220578 RepID=A0A0E9MXU0_9BACT|nr:histidine kinase [Flavihumibacter petaseus]GAO41940.1 putative two-component histidine kinase [Flavihumibacter petaseus NBRC 106054]